MMMINDNKEGGKMNMSYEEEKGRKRKKKESR
jgi:hypothetical protein